MPGVRVEVPIADAQSAATNSPTLTIPGTAAAGDIAFVTLVAGGATTTLTTPSGWTLKSGPNSFSSQSQWALEKKLVAGDVGSTVTFSLSASVRCSGLATIIQGGTDTGLLFATVDDSAGGSTTVTPTIASVPAGALYVVHFAWTRATGSPAPDITVASPYSQATGARTATNYGTSPEFSNEAAYEAAATAGSYGGDTLSTVNAGVGWNYAVAVPSGTVAASAAGTITLGGSPAPKAAATATAGAIALTGTPAPKAVAAATGSLTLAGAATPLGPNFGGAVSLAGSVSAAQAGAGAVGALTLAGSPSGQARPTSGGALTLTGAPQARGAASATGGVITLGGTALASRRFQIELADGWHPITPKVGYGTGWRTDIVVTIVPNTS